MSTPTNFGQTARKLYFDVAFTATQNVQVFACTPFRTGLVGDRFGALMAALQACTGSTPQEVKQRNEVTAWFQTTQATVGTVIPFNILFVGPTVGTNINPTTLPFLTQGGTVSAKNGHSAVFGTAGSLRHFSVKVSKYKTTTGVASGILYVQRQHSIEV